MPPRDRGPNAMVVQVTVPGPITIIEQDDFDWYWCAAEWQVRLDDLAVQQEKSHDHDRK